MARYETPAAGRNTRSTLKARRRSQSRERNLRSESEALAFPVAIAKAVYRADGVEFGVDSAELLPQPVHVATAGVLGGGGGGREDAGEDFGEPPDLPAKLEPVHARHHDVQDQDVGKPVGELLPCRLAVGIEVHAVSLPLQGVAHRLADVLLVVDYGHPSRGSGANGAVRCVEVMAVSPASCIISTVPGFRFNGA